MSTSSQTQLPPAATVQHRRPAPPPASPAILLFRAVVVAAGSGFFGMVVVLWLRGFLHLRVFMPPGGTIIGDPNMGWVFIGTFGAGFLAVLLMSALRTRTPRALGIFAGVLAVAAVVAMVLTFAFTSSPPSQRFGEAFCYLAWAGVILYLTSRFAGPGADD